MRTLTLPGVFRPRSDSWMLADAVREHGVEGLDVLDVFTGSGVVAARAASCGARSVTAIDVSRRAVLSARLNARLAGGRIDALRGDLFEPVGERRFDLITANPPYIPGSEIPARGAARAWEGGPGGRVLIDRFCRELADHLTARGGALIVHSSVSSPDRTLELLRDAGLNAEIIESRRGPLGPLVAARTTELERQRLLEAGEREEEVVVIEARWGHA